jgi:hypothetical protein
MLLKKLKKALGQQVYASINASPGAFLFALIEAFTLPQFCILGA